MPPGSGQSGLTAGGGRLTGAAARSGSGSNRLPRPRTGIRSPESGRFFSSNRSHPDKPSDSSSEVKSRRFISGRKISMCEGGGHLGGAGAQLLRRRQIVGELLVGVERAGPVAGLKLGGSGQLERTGAPRIPLRGQWLQPVGRGFRVEVGKAVHDREQRRQVPEFAVEIG